MSLGSFVSGFVPMLRLGSINFMMIRAVPQEILRTAEYKWASQERFGQMPALQFVGLGDETITLPGVIYPEWRGSPNAMSDMRAMAEQGQPQMLMDAQGNLYGRWVVKQVEETRSIFAAFTVPRKIEFNITLQKFDGTDSNALLSYLGINKISLPI